MCVWNIHTWKTASFFVSGGSIHTRPLKGGRNVAESWSPLNYTGNKSCIIQDLLLFTPPHEVYIEACFGSGELFFRKQPAKIEIVNDYRGDLINFWRVIRDDAGLRAFLEFLDWSLPSEDLFNENKEILKRMPNILDDLRLGGEVITPITYERVRQAVAFFENQFYSFSSTGQSFGIAGRDITKRKDRLEFAKRRLRTTAILHRDYRDVISYGACPGAFVFLDPPYKGTEKMYADSTFDMEQHKKLFRFAAKIDRKFGGTCKLLITYNNDQRIVHLAQKYGFRTTVKLRKDNMKQATQPGKLYEELLIGNYDMEAVADQNCEQLSMFDYCGYGGGDEACAL